MQVEFFDSLEAAQARLQQATKAADANVRPWQAAVRPGQLFIAESGEEGLLVFGEVLEAYREERLRHYRFCRCFSQAVPEGELGDVHVSTILCVVGREFFEAMRQEGWRVEAWPLPALGGGRAIAGEGGGAPRGRPRPGGSHKGNHPAIA